MLAIYSKFLDKLETLEKILLAASSAAMVVIIVYQVILRYCFNASNSWSEELARYLFIYDVMLAVEAKAEGGFYFCCDGSGDCFPWIPLFLLSHTLHGSGCEYFTWHQGFYGGAVCEYADWRGADDFNVNRSCFEKSGFSVQGNR